MKKPMTPITRHAHSARCRRRFFLLFFFLGGPDPAPAAAARPRPGPRPLPPSFPAAAFADARVPPAPAAAAVAPLDLPFSSSQFFGGVKDSVGSSEATGCFGPVSSSAERVLRGLGLLPLAGGDGSGRNHLSSADCGPSGSSSFPRRNGFFA